MEKRYYEIVAKIEEARKVGDLKGIRRWRNKLEKWQGEYGAYAPIK